MSVKRRALMRLGRGHEIVILVWVGIVLGIVLDTLHVKTLVEYLCLRGARSYISSNLVRAMCIESFSLAIIYWNPCRTGVATQSITRSRVPRRSFWTWHALSVWLWPTNSPERQLSCISDYPLLSSRIIAELRQQDWRIWNYEQWCSRLSSEESIVQDLTR